MIADHQVPGLHHHLNFIRVLNKFWRVERGGTGGIGVVAPNAAGGIGGVGRVRVSVDLTDPTHCSLSGTWVPQLESGCAGSTTPGRVSIGPFP